MKNVGERETDNVGDVQRRMQRIGILSLCLSALVLVVLTFLTSFWRIKPRAAAVSLPMLLMWSFVVTAYAFLCVYRNAKHTMERLHRLSIIDEATKGFNYRYLTIRMSEEYERCKRHGTVMSLLYMDLDGFKRVNDEFGHGAGNIILEELATLMGRIVRKSDVVGRWGGDEFLAILPETDRKDAKILANRLREAVANYTLDLGENQKVDFVRLSIGIAAFPINGSTMENVLAAADSAVYRSKEKGGNAVSVSDEYVRGDTAAGRSVSALRERSTEDVQSGEKV